MRTLRSRLVPTRAAVAVVAGLALVALAGCGGDDPETSTGTTTSATSSAATTSPDDEGELEPSEEPSAEPTTEEPVETESTAPAADVVVDVTITGGTVTTASDRVQVTVGQTVLIRVTSDVEDELHVHGFEIETALVPNQPAELELEVGTSPGPGLYEVETHESGLLLFQLEVR